MTNQSDKSKEFQKFEFYFFRDIDLSQNLFTILDPSTIDNLTDEEKILAEKMLVEALKTKYDKRWLWGLEEIASESAYEFLGTLYDREENTYDKCLLAFSLVRIKAGSSVLDFLYEVIKSDEEEQVKEVALRPLYWNKAIRYENEEYNKLFEEILHTAIQDKHKKIRLYAYEILVEYYNMDDYIPLKDPIKEIISEEHSKEEYHEALQQFLKLVESKQEYPFSRKILIQAIKELPDNPPTMKLADCKICSQIPEKSYADMAEGKSLGKYTSKLETAVIFAYYKNCIMRCPICGRLYDYNYHYEYLVNKSEEEEELIRTDTKGAIKKIDSFIKAGYDFKKITRCGIFLKIKYR